MEALAPKLRSLPAGPGNLGTLPAEDKDALALFLASLLQRPGLQGGSAAVPGAEKVEVFLLRTAGSSAAGPEGVQALAALPAGSTQLALKTEGAPAGQPRIEASGALPVVAYGPAYVTVGLPGVSLKLHYWSPLKGVPAACVCTY